MRLRIVLPLMASRLGCSDRVVVTLWWVTSRLAHRIERWRYRDTMVMASRDANRIYWTVAAPEKILP